MYCFCKKISKNKKAGFPGFFILVLLMIVATGCENDIEKVTLVTGKQALPMEMSKGLQILYSDSSRIKVKINAPELHRFDGENP